MTKEEIKQWFLDQYYEPVMLQHGWAETLLKEHVYTEDVVIELLIKLSEQLPITKNPGGNQHDDNKVFSIKDLEHAFNAGSRLINQEWHVAEFCTGEGCRCGGVRLNYNSFEEWLSINYPQRDKKNNTTL